MDQSTQEVMGLLSVSLAIAAGGRELLKDSNDILRTVSSAGQSTVTLAPRSARLWRQRHRRPAGAPHPL